MMRGLAANFEMAVFLNRTYAIVLDVTGYDAGKRAPQICREQVPLLIFVQFQVAHILMVGNEWLLKFAVYLQGPVEIVGVILLFAKIANLFDTCLYFMCNTYRIIDDDLVALLCFYTQGINNKLVDLFEILFGTGRPGKNQRERDLQIIRMQQYAQNIENFLGSSHPTGKTTIP